MVAEGILIIFSDISVGTFYIISSLKLDYSYSVVQRNFTPEIKHFICCLRDLFLLLVGHFSNSIWITGLPLAVTVLGRQKGVTVSECRSIQ